MTASFTDASIRTNSKILVLAPHPDDFDAIAVSLKIFRDNGNSLELAVLSGAESGVEDSFCEKHPGRTKAEIREQEQLESCKFFGLPESSVTFLRLDEDADGDLAESKSNLELMKKHLLKVKPDIVFMPHWNDRNPGHQRCYSMFRNISKTSIDWSLSVYFNRDPKTIGMRQDIFTPFDEEDAKWKGELLRFHKSQQQRNLNSRGHGFDERILQVNRRIARENSCDAPYAEAFEIQIRFCAKKAKNPPVEALAVSE